MKQYLFFDTETTGIPPRPLPRPTDFELWPRVIQIHWELRDEKGTELAPPSSFILKPEDFVIPPEVEKIHGIGQAYALAHGKPRDEVLRKFAESVRNVVLVAHNFEFDAAIVEVELLRLNVRLPLSRMPHICTMRQTTEFCALPSANRPDEHKPPKLSELYEKLFGQPFSGAHNAESDVRAMVECFYELNRRGFKFQPVRKISN
ncbi:MAG: 3'-5' exonuclease [Bacteroidia bacterium]|nr:3'-5' exonuclease [Bacteroidia bacterium]